MKTKGLLLVIFTIISMSLMAQKTQEKDYVFKYNCKHGETNTIGLYGGLYGSYSEVLGNPAGYLGARAAVVFNKHWGIGLGGYALNYDRKLTALVDEGTYHLQAGYTGMFVEYIQPLNHWGRINFSLLSGMGLSLYQYDKEYRDEIPYYEEIIDQETFAVLEPGFEFQVRLKNHWWLGAHATYRTTSPVRLLGVSENFLEGLNTGISLKVGLF